ncbi:Isochorismatase [compost metagenome]
MALPAIVPYSMPVESDMPQNKADWAPDASRAVLLIHDMQRYFLNAFRVDESPALELVANIQRLRKCCAELGIPVVYSAQPGNQTMQHRGLLQDFWGPGLRDDPSHSAIVTEISPGESDIMLTKWRYSAFQRTKLLDVMQQNGRDQLIVCGIYAHIGCLLTCSEAFMQDIPSFFAGDAVADFSLEQHRMALNYAAECCSVVVTTDRLVEQLKASASRAAEAVGASGVEDGVTEGYSHSCSPEVKEAVREAVASLLQEHPSNLGDGDNLIDMWGLDSIRIMALAEKWRRSGVEITFIELAERPTLAEWSSLLSLKSKEHVPNSDYFVG